jgi:2-polyprenyl-3-methyl-5-hydroxy-6-metoxy-1,4-benzoquinol methylase
MSSHYCHAGRRCDHGDDDANPEIVGSSACMIEAPRYLHPGPFTASSLSCIARELYADTPAEIRYKQIFRPYICPLHALIDFIPKNAALLDVGCGAGLFIALLARLGRIDSAVGFDADHRAICAAQSVARNLPNSARLCFEQQDVHAPWPAKCFDIVCLIDVLHHVPPWQHADLITVAAQHVSPGGIFLYKDMTRRPRWRAWANRAHDLLLARQWINYARINDVIRWATSAGLRLDQRGNLNMLWYGHEWCVFRR